jgi:hypothetical protein
MTTTPLPPSPETWAPPPPPNVPKRRFFAWRSDRPRWQIMALFIAAVLFGLGIGASGSQPETETVVDDEQVAELESRVDRLKDSADQLVAQRDDAYDQRDEAYAELETRTADLDARQKSLDERKAALDTRENQIASAETAAEANSFDNGVFVVGTDIQPGVYHSDGPSSDGLGSGYWARLSGLTGDDIITNAVPTGPTTVEILSSDVAFESSYMQTWVKVG